MTVAERSLIVFFPAYCNHFFEAAVFVCTQMNGFTLVVFLFNHIGSALRAFFIGGFVPADEVAFRISFTSVEFPVFTNDF